MSIKISEEFQHALKELRNAVIFFDNVNDSSDDEKIAVGQDHWNRLVAAANRVASFYTQEVDDVGDPKI